MEGKERITKLLFSVLLLIPIIADASSCESYLKDIQKRYSNVPGIIISYEREIISKTMNILGTGMKERIAKGKIFLKPPYFLRIEQEAPEHELVINNGKEVWWYIPFKKNAYRYKAEVFSRELDILKDIFTGMMGIKRDFYISLKKNEQNVAISLRPKKTLQDIEKIRIEANLKDFRIRVVKIYNSFGSTTCFRLKRETRAKLKKEIFSIHLPRETRIIEK